MRYKTIKKSFPKHQEVLYYIISKALNTYTFDMLRRFAFRKSE